MENKRETFVVYEENAIVENRILTYQDFQLNIEEINTGKYKLDDLIYDPVNKTIKSIFETL